MCLKSLLIKSNLKNYQVNFVDNNSFISSLKDISNSLFIIDSNVWEHYKDTLLCCLERKMIIVISINEDRKTLDTVQELYDQIMEYSPKKNLCLIALGGGILQDIAGFLASTLYRGVNWIFVPTTLLAQADSCIGAKTSLNYKKFKNLIGTFCPPSRVYVYPEFLKTQQKQDFYSGVGEMAKLYLMGGRKFTHDFIKVLYEVDNFNNNVILKAVQKCLLIKQSYIEEDEFDSGRRNMLNYGHCFGHAIESSTNFAISHGQAVVLGMIAANIAAQKKGVLSAENESFIRKKVLLPVFKTNMKNININISDTIEAMIQDKKNTGEGLALVMINDNYDMIKITDMQKNEAVEYLEQMKRTLTGELHLL